MLSSAITQYQARQPFPFSSTDDHGGEPPLTVRDTATGYVISADLCGVSEDDVMAHVSGRVLTIIGDGPSLALDDDEFPPALQYVVVLPPDIAMARASVRCMGGRFILEIPRA